MEQPIAQLRELDAKIGLIEEQHNEIMDSNAELAQTQSNFLDEAIADTQAILNDLHLLRAEIQTRIEHAKRASVLLSLIAQQEELQPVHTRVQKQQYEYFATREWYKKLLQDRT